MTSQATQGAKEGLPRHVGAARRTLFLRLYDTSCMDTLDWLVKRRLRSVLRREYDWVFVFDGPATLTAGCLWRLLEDGRIRLTSEDAGRSLDCLRRSWGRRKLVGVLLVARSSQ